MLLSLLLVFSQQMGYAHALTHTAASAELAANLALSADQAQAADGADGDPHLNGIIKLGLDHSCAQCLAVAQFTAAVDSRFHSFPLLDGIAVIGVAAPLAVLPARPLAAYHSRAPPVSFC